MAHLLGRVVIDRPPIRDAAKAEAALFDALTRKWPTGATVKFLITPGGVVRSDGWPKICHGHVGWRSCRKDLPAVFTTAKEALKQVLTDRVIREASGKAEFLTLGIDLKNDGKLAELVAVFEIGRQDYVGLTGKSYPTTKQERSLFQVTDLDTHLLCAGGERVLVLGCHDLTMFNPRGNKNQKAGSPRNQRTADMQRLVQRFQPTIAIQHPHLTDTPATWRASWLKFAAQYPCVKVWASGICYHKRDGQKRAILQSVCDKTQGGSERCLDIVVN